MRKWFLVILVPLLTLLLSAFPGEDIIQGSQKYIAPLTILKGGKDYSNGTAIHIKGDYWLSARHMIEGTDNKGRPIVLDDARINGNVAKVVDQGVAVQSDWILLISKSDLPDIPLSYNFKWGEYCYRIGNDRGAGLVPAIGVIACDSEFDGLISTSATFRPGASGGGFFNGNGELIGIGTAVPYLDNVPFKVPDTSMSYFLPICRDMFKKIPEMMQTSSLPKVSSDMKEIKYQTLDNKEISYEVTGPTVLNFWATWCFPCKKEFPEFAKEYDESFKLISLCIDRQGSPSKIVSDNNYKWDFGYNSEDYFDLSSIPVTIFIDKDGKIQKIYDYSITKKEFEAGLKLIR